MVRDTERVLSVLKDRCDSHVAGSEDRHAVVSTQFVVVAARRTVVGLRGWGDGVGVDVGPDDDREHGGVI
jgi:hypothetical protein